jgi:hypothetical protein
MMLNELAMPIILQKETDKPEEAGKEAKQMVTITLSDPSQKERFDEMGVSEGAYEKFVLYNSVYLPELKEVVAEKEGVSDEEIKDYYDEYIAGEDSPSLEKVQGDVKENLLYEKIDTAMKKMWKDDLSAKFTKAGEAILPPSTKNYQI